MFEPKIQRRRHELVRFADDSDTISRIAGPVGFYATSSSFVDGPAMQCEYHWPSF